MKNKDIARYLNKLGKLLELHDENPFKIRSYTFAYNALRKIDTPFAEMSDEDLLAIPGVGQTIVDKIRELSETGKLNTYEKYADITPSGIMEMLDIKGFGPKKIKVIWNVMGITTVGELLYACNENRLLEVKGFGMKTQQNLKQQLEYFVSSKGKYLFAHLEDEALLLEKELQKAFAAERFEVVGEMKRMMPEVHGIEVLTTLEQLSAIVETIDGLEYDEEGVLVYKGYPVEFVFTDDDIFGKIAFEKNSSEAFLAQIEKVPFVATEAEVFEDLGLAYVPAEYRESEIAYDQAKAGAVPKLIEDKDIKGVVHNHSKYSDGMNTIEQMAKYCMELGYEYLLMSDHSKAAGYAGGMKEEEVMAQFEEIDSLNKKYPDFKIYKGIEADILSDGSMDYGDDFLKNFDMVIASVHSNLTMNQEKAHLRLVKAIENPNTHMLGHPTGRLLLAREGYSIDHKYIIDACAENGMLIELNAAPQRLDLDWSWLPYALEKGIRISINPDAHSLDMIHYIHYGVCAARKGGLTADMCLNALPQAGFDRWIQSLT